MGGGGSVVRGSALARAGSARRPGSGDDRVLWLFGESEVDGIRVANTVAIQTGRDPSTAGMAFHWREEGGRPVAMFPAQGTRAL